MSNTAFSMDELELEGAELLPGRETLCCPTPPACFGGGLITIVAPINIGVGIVL